LGSIHALFVVELKARGKNLDQILRIGKIQASKSSAGGPLVFIPNAHGKDLCLWVDYEGQNKMTVLIRFPLPLINEIRDSVQDTKLFSKIDLKLGIILSESALAMNRRQPSDPGRGSMSIW
jgi:hypothetical protein